MAFVTQSTKLDGPELIEVLQVREVAYSLLARLFGEEPDPDFLRELHRRQVFMTFLYADENPEVREGTQRVAAHLAELETLGEDGFEALRWDYTRLFIGPDRLPAPPWESAYLTEERLLFQEPTLEVRRAYRKYGLLPTKVSAPLSSNFSASGASPIPTESITIKKTRLNILIVFNLLPLSFRYF